MWVSKRNVSGTRVKIHSFFSTISRKFVYFDYTNKFKIFDMIVKPEFCNASKYRGMLIPNRKKRTVLAYFCKNKSKTFLEMRISVWHWENVYFPMYHILPTMYKILVSAAIFEPK